VAARVYEAYNRRTGAPALLLKPRHSGDWLTAPRPWEARVVSMPGALALELEPGNMRSREDIQEVTLGLQRLTTALANVEDHPEVAKVLALPVAQAAATPPAPAVRPGYLAALACAVVLALVGAPRSQRAVAVPRPATPEVELAQLAPVVPLEEPAPASVARRSPAWEALARPMPDKPFKGQALPKKGKCEPGEVVINNGCWVALRDVAPPCGDRYYEWKGGCYVPMFPEANEPRAALPRGDASGGEP
jgi:hypothetical protein